VPEIPGLSEAGCRTNLDVFDLAELPRRLVVLGGGPLGAELAQAFARLGSKVTVVEAAARILNRAEPEASRELTRAFEAEGIEVLAGHRAAGVSSAGGAKTVELAGPDGGSARVAADEILVALGRRSATEGLGLERAGVETDDRGAVTVDRRLRTSARHIYALGDVTARHRFTHMAEYDAGVVVMNAVYGLPVKASDRVVPWCVYTDPEVASAGLTEARAREAGRKVRVYRFALAEGDRPVIEGRDRGFVKVVVEGRKVAGVAIVAARAETLLAEWVLALSQRLPVGAIARAIHVYPGWAGVSKRAAGLYYLDTLFKGWLVRIAHRLKGLRGWVGEDPQPRP
jgi:pyruvate/2-oxoglutarate dehydrogenase complex dihydrolipoamide dehydrogenase (E3) component